MHGYQMKLENCSVLRKHPRLLLSVTYLNILQLILPAEADQSWPLRRFRSIRNQTDGDVASGGHAGLSGHMSTSRFAIYGWLCAVTGRRGRNLVHGLRPWCFRKHTKFCHTAVCHRLPHTLTACFFGSSSELTGDPLSEHRNQLRNHDRYPNLHDKKECESSDKQIHESTLN
jgi:hypothetical protein